MWMGTAGWFLSLGNKISISEPLQLSCRMDRLLKYRDIAPMPICFSTRIPMVCEAPIVKVLVWYLISNVGRNVKVDFLVDFDLEITVRCRHACM